MISLLFSLALLQQDALPASEPPASERTVPADPSTVPEVQAEPELNRDAVLADINAYLNSIGTLRARFNQVAPDGSAAGGVLSMARPGRLRFEYDDPSPIRVIADGTTVAIEDRALETVDRVPLRSTPLWWLLKGDIDIAEDAEIVGLESEYGFLYLTLRDPSGDMQGEIMFVFAEPDYELREWFVTDALGEITRVSLSDVETGVRLNPRLFVIPEAEDRRDSRRGR
ncbi:outer membrane lipoprotein carrier protein LolA [Maricaulis sp.]|uniref:LolA family protein n=1 Tax=Maricaulis sp. TaxID=1486257 RepID=UPI002617BFCA|nr:outer membrane lipoprotein carrier protein LolA [Maricaulis sp.]